MLRKFRKFILKSLDPVRVITMFDGVFSSSNLIKELMILVLTIKLVNTKLFHLECCVLIGQIRL